MDPVQFLKCISFFSLDRIIIYWNRLYDLRSLVGLPVWFCWTTDLDDIVRAFMNIQGGLVGYSMVRGHLRSMDINVQRERIRASISSS